MEVDQPAHKKGIRILAKSDFVTLISTAFFQIAATPHPSGASFRAQLRDSYKGHIKNLLK
jgi:hypothetical protein